MTTKMARTSKKASNYRGFVYLIVGSNPTGRTKNEPEHSGSFCLCFCMFLSEIRYFYLKMLFYLKIVMRGFSRKIEKKHAKTRDFAYQNGHEKWPRKRKRRELPRRSVLLVVFHVFPNSLLDHGLLLFVFQEIQDI